MLEKYESAIDKIRRIDCLKDELKSLKGEDGRLSSSASVYRKKNDWREKAENDAAITDINERRAVIGKREALVKAEIKSLRAEVYGILSECFAEAKSEEHRAKIREACLYASDGRMLVSQTGSSPSDFGKCKIIGKRVTRDESLDGKVEKVVRAGIRNTSGKFIILPEVVLYAYDAVQEEGEYSVVNELYPRAVVRSIKKESTRSVQSKQTDALETMKERVSGKQSIVALICSIVYSAFYLWATLIGVSESAFGGLMVKFAVGYALVAVLVILSGYSRKISRLTDGMFAFFSLYSGVLSAFALVFSKAAGRVFCLPLAMALSGMATIALYPSHKDKKSTEVGGLALPSLLGVILGLLCSWVLLVCSDLNSGDSSRSFEIFAYCVLAFVAISGVVASIVSFKRRGVVAIECRRCVSLAAATCLVTAFFTVWYVSLAAAIFATVFACVCVFGVNRDV